MPRILELQRQVQPGRKIKASVADEHIVRILVTGLNPRDPRLAARADSQGRLAYTITWPYELGSTPRASEPTRP
ncbi:MAG: hypothetical protein J7M34_11095, partial [Anaerolineae bacterium]|nr:hypothetical protein [Anaerolineae bacterium]